MANTDRTHKLIIRTAFVTSTTIATLVGAQSFALLDLSSRQNDTFEETTVLLAPQENTASQTLVLENNIVDAPQVITQAIPAFTILHTEPSITILRHSEDAGISVSSNTNTVIQPPVPSAIQAPEPIIIQPPVAVAQQNVQQPTQQQQSRPQPQRSRSSR